MIKLFYLLAALLFSPVIYGQSYESIKAKAILQQYRQAKDDIDKAMQNDRFNAKPEAYLLKATIYSGLANDVLVKGTPEENSLLNEAETAFTRYSQLDPDLILLIDPTYQNSIINFYTWFYTKGYKDYEAGQWQLCYEKLKKAVAFSDILIAKKIISTSLDTNVLILAGIAAESSGNKEEAVKYYGRLADNKVTGDGFESVYRFLVSHYFAKKDLVSFEKYKALGEQLFPKSEYFKYDKIDFAIGLEESFEGKVKAVEDVLASDPVNYNANQILGELIYDTLNSTHEDAVLPANAAELEEKMISAFIKAAEGNPNTANAYLFIGNHFINIAIKIDELRKSAIISKGTSKDALKRKLELDEQYGEALLGALSPYEKAALFYEQKSSLDESDKRQYKNIASYLADIYNYKQIQAGVTKAEKDKFLAKEKKWNDTYDKITTDKLGEKEEKDKLVVRKNENNPSEQINTKKTPDKKDEETRTPSKGDGLKLQNTQQIIQVGKYYALVIGVSDYNDSRLNIPNPKKDAKLLADLLIQRYTFTESSVSLILNPTREKIFSELFRLRKLLGPTDNLLIFFAGHGYWDEDTKQGYWWPKDASSDNSSYWLSNSDLREQIRGIKSAHTLLISDACFSGGIFRSRSGIDITKASLDIQLLYKMPSRRAMTSGTMTEVPDESVFLQFLTKRLANNQSKFLSTQQLYESFRIAVINNSKVVPQEGVISECGDEGGDFIFILKD